MTRKLLIVLTALLLVACNSRGCKCHMGHEEVNYHSAYTTEDCHEHCSGRGHNETCSTDCDTRHHPARCTVDFVCDMTCKAADTGAREAHPDHPVRNNGRTNLSPFECYDDGRMR